MSYWKCGVAAAAANCVVLALSVAFYGPTIGGGAAARNTARVAALIFLAAFAAPGLRRWLNVLEPSLLVTSYVAAQMVHYTAVALLHTIFATAPLVIGVPQVAIVVVGFSLVTIMAGTANSQSRFAGGVHKSTLYIVFLILAADYSSHPVKSMRLAAIPVVAALVLRWLPRASKERTSAAASGS